MPHRTLSPAPAAFERPSHSLDPSRPPAVISSLPIEMHIPPDAPFQLPRRPSDEWREFFHLDRRQTDRTEMEQSSEGVRGSEEGAEEQGASWTTVFPGESVLEGNAELLRLAAPVESLAMYPQQAGGSFDSASSAASSISHNLDTLPSHSVTSAAPTSLAASPRSSIETTSPVPSVLQAAPGSAQTTPRASSHPSVPSVLLSGGHSSIMPRRSPAPIATKPRKARKSKSSGVEATSSINGTNTLLGGVFHTSQSRASPRDTVGASMPHSAPATTTTFSRRLATHEGIIKKIKDEHKEEFNFAPSTPAQDQPVLAKFVLRKASVESVDDIAPAVVSAPAPRPRRPKARPEGHTPRPPNAWILYRSAQIQILKADEEISKKPQSDICESSAPASPLLSSLC